MYSRLLNMPDNKSFFLFGPRGTGKTTWVKSTFKDAIYLDLLDSELFNDLLARPKRIENFIPKGYEGFVVLDEVQKIPELLNEVHRLIENGKCKFVLTGSSARKLRRGGVNLLAGRALTKTMHPLTAAELKESYDLNRSIAYGQLPCVYTESDPKAYLESYVKTYLQEEILNEGLTRNLGAFSRFLEAASFSQGSVLNISSVARECAIERKVVESYFTILEDLLVAYRVPIFAKKAKRKMAVHPKFYFFDAGLYRTLRPMGPLDAPEEIQGAAIETLLFQELVALNSYLNLGYTIFYWRTADDLEVDFVLYGPRGIKAFEIKRTARPTSQMLKGLKSFLKDYPQSKACFLYGGERREWDNQIEIIPISEAMKELPAIL